VESIFKHGRPLSSVTHVKVEAQTDNKLGSNTEENVMSKRFLHILSLLSSEESRCASQSIETARSRGAQEP
jgi:hypothetical protein